MFISKILTIVIPCKNEKDNIIECLNHLDFQYKIKNTRVIIVDSSDDDTRSKINSKNYENIKVEIIGGGSTSVSRSNGALLTKTPYILFLDADILLKDIKTIDECLKDIICYGIDLITIRFKSKDKELSYVYKTFELLRDLFFNLPMCLGGFMMVNKESFLKKGGFNEKSNSFEDFEFSMKIHPKKFIVNNFICESKKMKLQKDYS